MIRRVNDNTISPLHRIFTPSADMVDEGEPKVIISRPLCFCFTEGTTLLWVSGVLVLRPLVTTYKLKGQQKVAKHMGSRTSLYEVMKKAESEGSF